MNPVETQSVTVCPFAEMRPGDRRVVEVDGIAILVIRLDKQVVALKNQCSHLDFPIDDGRIIGRQIMCRRHGARFDLDSGKPLGGPAVRAIPTFPVETVDGQIVVRYSRPKEGWSFAARRC